MLIVLLNFEVALATVGVLIRLAFFIVIGVVAYFFWRDIGRREIDTWPTRSSRVFYAAIGLGVVDLGWWLFGHPSGPGRTDLLRRRGGVHLRRGPHLARPALARLERTGRGGKAH